MTSIKIPAILATLGFATIATTAHATSIPVANHSFEEDNVTGSTLGGEPPAQWSQAPVGTVSPYQAIGTAYCINKDHTKVTAPVPLPDGSDKMAMIRYDLILYQTLTTKIEPNTTYTLKVDAALREPTPVEPVGATIRLGTGSTVDANLLTPNTEVIPVLKADSWVLWEATFTTGDTIPDDFLRVEVYWPREDGDGDPQGLFDNVRLDTAAAPAAPFQLTITPATAPDTGFDLEWNSHGGRRYNLRTSTDLVGAIPTWELVEGDIVATPPTNWFNVDSAAPRRFYAVEEFDAPPLLAADFEGDDGGFTQSTDAGTAWEWGTPDSSGLGGTVDSGNGADPGSGKCWGTGIGSPGYYANPTTNSRLISPAIDLTSVAAAVLGFSQAIDVEANDSVVVRLYNAATNDEIVFGDFPLIVNDPDTSESPWTASGPHALPVGAPIRIAWILSGTGGDTEDYMGWYIDDVLVKETAP